MRVIPSRIFTILLVILSSFLALPIFKVKAQQNNITVPGNWSQIATFAGDRGAPITTNSFTCNHAEWRIRWEAYLTPHIYFYFENHILQITTFTEGTKLDYIDFINASFSSIYDSGNLASGTSYIHENAGNFYLRIKTSPSIDSYRIYIEQNTDSPTLLPTPTPSPTSTPSPESESEFPKIQLLTLALTVIIGLGILVYSIKKSRTR